MDHNFRINWRYVKFLYENPGKPGFAMKAAVSTIVSIAETRNENLNNKTNFVLLTRMDFMETP